MTIKNINAPLLTTITLATAITVGDKEINELIMRNPKGGDLRGLALSDVLRSDMDAIKTLLPRIVTNFVVLPEHIDNMDLNDLTAVYSGIAGFLGRSA